MAPLLPFLAMAHQRNVSAPAQALQQPQCKFLAMIFNIAISPINSATLPELLSITPAELVPSYRALSKGFE